MNARSLVIAALLATSTQASTLRVFEPGASPCGDACPLEWAAEAFDVPVGTPTRRTLPAGSVLDGMSYAVNGVPYTKATGYVTDRPHEGEGYRLPDGRVFFRFDACSNWAPARPAVAPIFPAPLALPASSLAATPTFVVGGGGRSYRDPPLVPLPPPVPPPAPPAVFLPPSGWLSVTGFFLLFLLRRRWHGREA